jgi:hypothetical protein
MSWWNHKSKPDDPPEFVYGKPGTSVEVTIVDGKVLTEVIVPETTPPDPEPDLATKPKDIVGYCFGYACPKKHLFSTFESVTVDGYKERRACQQCGAVAKPAVVKRTAEPQWGNRAHIAIYDRNPKPNWGWFNAFWQGAGSLYSGWVNDPDLIWTKYEFVHYLETPKRRKK